MLPLTGLVGTVLVGLLAPVAALTVATWLCLDLLVATCFGLCMLIGYDNGGWMLCCDPGGTSLCFNAGGLRAFGGKYLLMLIAA
jgi:hypothetical protein